MAKYMLCLQEIVKSGNKLAHSMKVGLSWHVYVPCGLFSKEVNTLRPRQNGRHFADDIFMCILFNENCCILIKFSLKYVRKGPIDNNPTLVQIMAWRRSGDKPLSEPMMISLSTHICVTRPQWVKPRLAKRPLKTNGHLAQCGLTSLVKEATAWIVLIKISPNRY